MRENSLFLECDVDFIFHIPPPYALSSFFCFRCRKVKCERKRRRAFGNELMWGEWLRGRELCDNHTILFKLDKLLFFLLTNSRHERTKMRAKEKRKGTFQKELVV